MAEIFDSGIGSFFFEPRKFFFEPWEFFFPIDFISLLSLFTSSMVVFGTNFSFVQKNNRDNRQKLYDNVVEGIVSFFIKVRFGETKVSVFFV